MLIAETASGYDPALARDAITRALSLFEDTFAIASVPDNSYTLTDAVRLYARLGEYRLAREAAERAGQGLAGARSGVGPERDARPWEMDVPPPPETDPRKEKNELLGGGILGGYNAILESELRKVTQEGARSIFDRTDLWPQPVGIYVTAFNRG
ncbi:MAG: hypothetical protein HC855_09605 [Rhizobiales bacterium]|nr:hypothetical protein [Hyphomicrobiales bacterium]